jgi:hypothetical protein
VSRLSAALGIFDASEQPPAHALLLKKCLYTSVLMRINPSFHFTGSAGQINLAERSYFIVIRNRFAGSGRQRTSTFPKATGLALVVSGDHSWRAGRAAQLTGEPCARCAGLAAGHAARWRRRLGQPTLQLILTRCLKAGCDH